MWMGKSGMSTRVYSGLKSQLETLAPEIGIESEIELPDEATAAAIYNEWLKSKDGIVFLRSTGAKFVSETKPTIPIFVGACNNPMELGAVSSLEAPEGNITGVTYFLKAAQHLKIYRQIFPKLSSIGLILETGHPGSLIDQKETQAGCRELGLNYHEIFISKTDNLKEKIARFASEADLLVISNTGLIIDNAESIAEAAGSTPVASYAEAPVNNRHAFIGFVPSDDKLGRMLAVSIIDVLLKNRQIRDVPVKMDDQPTMVICADKMKHWKVPVPFNMLKVAKVIP